MTDLWEKQHHPQCMTEKNEAQKVTMTSLRSHHQERRHLLCLAFPSIYLHLPHPAASLLKGYSSNCRVSSLMVIYFFPTNIFFHRETPSYKAKFWNVRSSNHRLFFSNHRLFFYGEDQPTLKHWILSWGWSKHTLSTLECRLNGSCMRATATSSLRHTGNALVYCMVLTKYLFKGWVK